MSRILKWTVPLDGKWHKIGKGPAVLVAEIYRDPDYMSLEGDFANVWTIEPDEGYVDPVEKVMAEQGAKPKIRVARVFGTNQEYPNNCGHLGSYRSGIYVWHMVAGIILEENYDATNT